MKKFPEINRLKKLFAEYKKVSLIEISRVITKNGEIFNIERRHKFPCFYDNGYGEICMSHYHRINFDENGNLQVQLTNGIWISEKELNIKHIEDVLYIIDWGFGYQDKK